MKFLGRLTLIALLGFFAPFYFPWWSLLVISILVGFIIPGRTFMGFIAGFLAGSGIWLGLSLQLDYNSASVLTDKMVTLMGLEDATRLLIISGLIGGLVAGIGAATGSSFRKLFRKKAQTSFYS